MGLGSFLNKTRKAYTNAPEDVWFSRNIDHQHLQHFMLVVKYHRLELVRIDEDAFRLDYSYERGWTVDIERQDYSHQRGTRMNGGYDGWSMCRVGYCRATDLTVDGYVQGLLRKYPKGKNFTWTESQALCREVAEEVLHARDPQWFQFFWENMDPRRQHVAQLPSPEPAGLPHVPPPSQQQYAPAGGHVPNVELFNHMQHSMLASQQQANAINQQIMQNVPEPTYGR